MQVGQKKCLWIKKDDSKEKDEHSRGRASPWGSGHKLLVKAQVRCWGSLWPQPRLSCSLVMLKQRDKYGSVTGGWGASQVANELG